uniref:Toll-like receptor 13 n=1 Tax=Argyrosomus japonicus TaxID=448029 RepID=A0A7M1XYI7_ARGJA|nr:toll-like receptor 13 [Argyrosomus japonicus]
MVRTVLFLLLLNTSACCGFGFKGCSQNFPATNFMWCFYRNITNLTDVVSMFPDNLTAINLSKNRIQVVPPGSFSRVLGLKNLDLSQNQLVFLKGGEFRGLHVLGFLNLTCNNISYIHSSAFDGLIGLQTLLLNHNMLQTFSPDIFNSLPAIKAVNLSLNRLKAFSCGESGGSSTLTDLDLLANNIQRINVSCFPALEYIRLSNNSEFKLQEDAFASNPRLKSLLCQGVKVEMLLGLSAETKKNLSRVAFSLFVEKSPFTICDLLKGMDQLERIEVDLKGSKLPQTNTSLLNCATPPMVIIMDANLGNVAHLSLGRGNTSKLYLNNCGLKQISHTTFDYHGLVTLQMNENKVIIQQDTFKNLNNLSFLGLDKNKLHNIDPNWFIPLKKLTRMTLIKNEITELTPKAFSALTQLEELYLQFNLLKYITKKPFSRLRRLRKLNLSLNIIDFIEEGTFEDLKSLSYLDLSGNRIKRLTPAILSGLVNLKQFVLYNNRLHFKSYESPFISLTSLERLRKLTLYRTDLDDLPANLMPPDNTLEILKVTSNHLHTVDKAMLDALPRLRILDITENPLTCSCDNAWFKTWAIHNTQTQVSYLYNMQCDNDQRFPYLWQFDDKACSFELASFTLFITCSVLDVLFMCVCVFWHIQGPALRYLMLILRAKLRGRRGGAEARFQYDAFVSYSSKDEAWVMEQLMPNLEKPAAGAPRLRLCLHHRDFRPGAAVLANIEAAIYNSRHTICVVTRHFLQSEWCSLEFQLASLRLLFDGSDVLLLVFLEEIPEHCLSPYRRLRKIIRKKTYLLWPKEPQEEDAFWVRLIDALKDNREEEEEEGGREDELARLIG